MLRSQVCTHASLTSPELQSWADELRPAWTFAAPAGARTLAHRKIWEWLFVARALEERGVLQPGRRGLGFGVGHEPLVAAFADRGCRIVATDLDPARAAAAGWVETEQHATGLDELNPYQLCDPDDFRRRVTFRVVDMTRIPSDLRDFDFAWSLCALEHLGTLVAGLEFILASLGCVRPGGLVVHTTEFNASSDDETIAAGPTVLYRRRDIEWLVRRLRHEGHDVEPVDYDTGDHPADRHVDVPPYTQTHLRMQLDRYVATSLALVVRRRRRDPGVVGRLRRLPSARAVRRMPPVPPPA